MKEKFKSTVGYPLYDVCLMKEDGEEKVVSEKVPLRKGIEILKRFDRLLVCNGKIVKDIMYCYLKPLRDIRPHYDAKLGVFTYYPEQLNSTTHLDKS